MTDVSGDFEIHLTGGEPEAEALAAFAEVDWQNFRDEYPGVEGDVASWQHRLAVALSR